MTNLAKIGIVLATGTVVVVGGGTAIYVTMNHNPVFPDSITNQDGSIDVKFSYNVFLLSEPPTVPTETPKSENTFGYRYWYLLVDPDRKENEDWWKKSYQEWRDSSNTNSEAPFNEISMAFHHSNANKKALNQACKEVFSLEDKSFTNSSTNADDLSTKFLSLNSDQSVAKIFWKYCSVLGRKPTSLIDSQEAEKLESKESQFLVKNFTNILVSTKDGENDLFWKIKNDWVQRNKESILDSFNWFYKAIASKIINKHTLALQKICQYAQKYNFTDKNLFEFYLKGCSFVDYPFSFK